MVGLVVCFIAVFWTFLAARRSLGAGLQVLLLFGYAYGFFRGRYPSAFSHFIFDASLVSLYFGYFSQPTTPEDEYRSGGALVWTRILVVWPMIVIAYSSFIEASQPVVVQLVGLRGAAFMLPGLVLGARLQQRDLDRLAPTFAVLNVIALAVAGLEYVYGVAAVMPENMATQQIYAVRDIAGASAMFHRIPSIFINAHGYGGTMALSVPFLLHGLDSSPRVRTLCAIGLGAAVVGTFLCGARLPVAELALVAIYALLTMRMRLTTLFAFVLIAGAAWYLVTHNARLQRFETLADTDAVEARISGSVNVGFFDLLGEYPLGAGLASAFGTSVPYFMHDLANPPIGIESEYGHLLCEQGIPGLLLWLGFIAWLLTRTSAPKVAAPIARTAATAFIFLQWPISLLGVGALSAIPGTTMLYLLCGMRLASPVQEKAALALRHVGQRFVDRGAARSPFGARPNGARSGSIVSSR